MAPGGEQSACVRAQEQEDRPRRAASGWIACRGRTGDCDAHAVAERVCSRVTTERAVEPPSATPQDAQPARCEDRDVCAHRQRWHQTLGDRTPPPVDEQAASLTCGVRCIGGSSREKVRY